jgi:phosphatidylglycerophosphate synthase
MEPGAQRRPLRSRRTAWARALAAALARRGVGPNAISLAGLALGLAGGAALAARGLGSPGPAASAALLVGGAAGNQLRLLCNLLDGLVAVEHGAGGPDGELYNELPDRLSDAATLAGAGLAARTLAGAVELGLLAALLAVLCAHVRTLGASAGAGQVFAGPLSKPWRGALLTLACLVAAALVERGLDAEVLRGALALIAAGTAWTCVRRARIVRARLRGSA